MAEAAVTIFLETMSHLESYHADLICGSENELRQMKKDLAFLKAFLRDVATKRQEEEEEEEEKALQDIKRQIKEAVYEVEEAVDACLSQPAAVKMKKVLIRHMSLGQTKLAKEIDHLREDKVKQLLENIKEYNSTLNVSTPTRAKRRSQLTTQQRPIRNNRVVVGLEDDVDTIIGFLMKQSEKLGIVSITGKPGLGKTTLARKIFEDERVAREFRNRSWLYISRKFEARNFFLSILKMFTSQDMSSLNEEELSGNVKAFLKAEKFLLVLDDVWSVKDWESIYSVLPDSNGRGKVVITSSKSDVAAPADVLHSLRARTPDESWELIRTEVFGRSGTCPDPELEEIGKIIAGECQGLPLDILVVAGVLADRVTKNEWQKLSENGLSNVVELTYLGFPDDLRECFLYMGVFPEDYEVSAWTLTRLWIAEGLVQPEEGKCLEEIAAKNLDALITRNLVVAGRLNSKGEVKTCRLHDKTRAFCIIKSEEQKLFQDTKKLRTGILEGYSHDVENTNGSQVRALFSSREQRVESSSSTIASAVAAGFRKLRNNFFEARKLGIGESKSIEFHKLFHLRYLILNIGTLTTLPESISQLWNLQTLVVEAKSHSITTKANVWNMIWLRHIKTNAAIVLASKDDQAGVASENLQTINTLSLEACTEDVLKRARNLKALGIRGRLGTHSGSTFLEKLERLEKLKLVNDLHDEVASTENLVHLLRPNYLPPNLKFLTLSNTFLDWKHISNLAKIKTLKSLKLKDNAFTGIYWSVADDSFPSLQLLAIDGADLIQWETSTKSFPCLRSLMLKDCGNLNGIPRDLAKKGLERLDIYGVRKSVVESAKRITEDINQAQESKKAESRIPFKLYIGPGCYC